MTETGIDRTPVEIWIYILELCLTGPLNWYSNDDIAQDRRLFIIGCEAARSFYDSARIINNMRLVCRSWNMILQGKQLQFIVSHDFITTNPFQRYKRGIQRYEYHSFEDLGKKGYCPSRCDPCKALYRRQQDLGDEDLQPNWDQLESLLLHRDALTSHQKIPSYANKLRVLSWRAGLPRLDPVIRMFNNLQGLTHLYLCDVGPLNFARFSQDINLPNLIMLSIQLWFGWDQPGEVVPYSQAAIKGLPKLRRLEINEMTSGQCWPQAEDFILAYASTIQELVLQGFLGQSFMEPQAHWDRVKAVIEKIPALTLYGTDKLGLRNDCPRMDMKAQSLRFLMIDSSEIFSAPQVYFSSLDRVITSFRVGTLIIDESWRDLQWKMPNRQRQNHMKTIGEGLDTWMGSGTIIEDVNGTPLSTPSSKFLRQLGWERNPPGEAANPIQILSSDDEELSRMDTSPLLSSDDEPSRMDTIPPLSSDDEEFSMMDISLMGTENWPITLSSDDDEE